MSKEKGLIYSNLAVCVGIFLLGYLGQQYQFAIGGMAMVQSVNLPVLYNTYLEAKTNQIKYEEPPRGKP